MPKIIYTAAQALSQIGVMRVVFPLLAVVGPLVFLYYGHMGVTQRRTLLFGIRGSIGRKNVGPAVTIEGTSAVVFGVIYVVSGIVCAGVMLPIAGAMFALW